MQDHRPTNSSLHVSWVQVVGILALVVIYSLLPNARPDLTQFNADDSESYLALSYALTHGLGYTRSLVAGLYVPHTTWPPGFPLLLAPVTAVMGLPMNWLVLKAYMIGIGIVGVGLSWLYVRRVTESRFAADVAALLLALAPFYWLFSRTVMTEVPQVVFVLLALLLMDRAWAKRIPQVWQVAMAGLVGGLGMLLHGTVVGLLAVPFAYAVGERQAYVRPWNRWGLLAVHGAAFSIPSLAWFVRNRFIDTKGLGFDGISQVHMLLAVSPTDQASHLLTMPEILQNAFRNLVYQVIYHVPDQIIPGLWDARWWEWRFAPFLALVLTLLVATAALPRRSAAFPIAVMILVNCAILGVYALGGSIRFWIPVTSLTIVLIVINAAPWLSRMSVGGRALLVYGILSCMCRA